MLLVQASGQDPDIGVSIQDKSIDKEKNLGPVEEKRFTSTLARDWPDIKDKVWRILDESEATKGMANNVTLLDIGHQNGDGEIIGPFVI